MQISERIQFAVDYFDRGITTTALISILPANLQKQNPAAKCKLRLQLPGKIASHTDRIYLQGYNRFLQKPPYRVKKIKSGRHQPEIRHLAFQTFAQMRSQSGKTAQYMFQNASAPGSNC